MASNTWATFVRKPIAKNFQKLPNLVTLILTTSEKTLDLLITNWS